MARNRNYSQPPDWKDVTSALLEFERELGCRIEVTMSPAGSPGRPALLLKAQALAVDTDQLVVRVLGCASVRMPTSGAGDLCAALLSLGYELDKDAYRRQTGIMGKTA